MDEASETATTGAVRKREQDNATNGRAPGRRGRKGASRKTVILVNLEVQHDDMKEIENWMKKNMKALHTFTGINAKINSITLTEKER